MSSINVKRHNKRVVIEEVSPEIDAGAFPIKRTKGESVVVRASVFADGHDEVKATILYRREDEPDWCEVRMKPLGNDRWIGSFLIREEVNYVYSVRGYVCPFTSWRAGLQKKNEAEQDLSIDLKIGAQIIEDVLPQMKDANELSQVKKWAAQIRKNSGKNKAYNAAMNLDLLMIMERYPNLEQSATYQKELRVDVERKRAIFSSWYELFPRSWSKNKGAHGTFKDCEARLPAIKSMGFDIVYLPPIHPIGVTKRKGKNNAVVCEPDDPGSPWAIGSAEGGHKAVHPQLGTLKSFTHFLEKAKEYDMEIALDLAFQCSPDHPYVKEHPQWFKWRPDGSVQYAENPPKKYEDAIPIDFETEDWEKLWEELKSIVVFWIQQGVRIFRVDNPHTKPFVFWEWLIAEIKRDYPGIIFLSEAFTRPHVMYRLAKIGFSQSYTYFTWRQTKREFIDYVTELTQTEVAEYFRPNFWPNTPDILPEHLQYGGRSAFIVRAVLAATLSSNFGIYGPVFELCISKALPGREEYIDSEKYEIKHWRWDQAGNIKDVLTKLNNIRRQNACLQLTRNIRFLHVDNENLLAFYKATGDFTNIILVVVNLDFYHTQIGNLYIPLNELGIDFQRPFCANDLLNEEKIYLAGEIEVILSLIRSGLRPILFIYRET